MCGKKERKTDRHDLYQLQLVKKLENPVNFKQGSLNQIERTYIDKKTNRLQITREPRSGARPFVFGSTGTGGTTNNRFPLSSLTSLC